MKHYNLGKGTVLNILHEAGVIRKRRHPSPEQIDEMVRHYEHGWSLVKVGEHYGFSQGAVWLWLKEQGVVMRKAWERTNALS